MATLGIIPARGGSKGVRRKNLRFLGGKPLIHYTIETAKRSLRLDRLVVSTEDSEIAGVARDCNCEVIERSRELAEDTTSMVPVVLEALNHVDGSFDYTILLQPTCPFRIPADIDSSLELLHTTGAAAVIGVHRVEDMHPARMYTICNGALLPIDPNWETASRQELPLVYHRNGLIYGIRTEVLRKERTFFPNGSLPFPISNERCLNIDTEWDFFCAQLLMGYWKNESFEFRS